MIMLKSTHDKIVEETMQDYEDKLKELGELAQMKLDKTISLYEDELDKAEKTISLYEKYISNVDANIRIADKKIDDVDASGHFRSDDEVGAFFRTLKTIRDNLNKFLIEKEKL